MHSDNRWHEATAGRVYPEGQDPLAQASADVRDRLNLRAHFARNRAAKRDRRLRFAEPLVKPAAYKALNETSCSGPSYRS